ncbi:hypothetical protein GCM10027447_19930 [Glycomyces halotolerans]
MSLEDKLSGWTGPSSYTEKDKQERTERMIRDAVNAHPPFEDCTISVYAKGSYANNTNVTSDSDVDIAVQCNELTYWDKESKGAHPPGSTPYSGIWTPEKFRTELENALEAKFPGQVDSSGSTAFEIDSGSARVNADVVPCFNYKYYMTSGRVRPGAKVFKTDGTSVKNYPAQQLENGIAKNNRTGKRYKKAVRIMKRVENAMVAAGVHREVPSFFVECLVYNCPDSILKRDTWTEVIRGVIVHIWDELQGSEPTDNSARWVEASECKYLFHDKQKWNRADGREFAKAAWNYLEYSS